MEIQKIDDFKIRITTPLAPKVTDIGIDELKEENEKDLAIIARAQARIKNREDLLGQAEKLGAKSKRSSEESLKNQNQEEPISVIDNISVV